MEFAIQGHLGLVDPFFIFLEFSIGRDSVFVGFENHYSQLWLYFRVPCGGFFLFFFGRPAAYGIPGWLRQHRGSSLPPVTVEMPLIPLHHSGDSMEFLFFFKQLYSGGILNAQF